MESENGRLRPDMIVHLPGGTRIVVDAKVPLHQFIAAAVRGERGSAGISMNEHARLVRNHVQQLSSREYWKQFDHSPEFVVLFVPGESFFSAALQNFPR